MIKTVCDSCGKEIKKTKDLITMKTNNANDESFNHLFDLCHYCARQIIKVASEIKKEEESK